MGLLRKFICVLVVVLGVVAIVIGIIYLFPTTKEQEVTIEGNNERENDVEDESKPVLSDEDFASGIDLEELQKAETGGGVLSREEFSVKVSGLSKEVLEQISSEEDLKVKVEDYLYDSCNTYVEQIIYAGQYMVNEKVKIVNIYFYIDEEFGSLLYVKYDKEMNEYLISKD